MQFLVGRGCGQCRRHGYRGRYAIGELLRLNDGLRSSSSIELPSALSRRPRAAAGTRFLRESALALVAVGGPPSRRSTVSLLWSERLVVGFWPHGVTIGGGRPQGKTTALIECLSIALQVSRCVQARASHSWLLRQFWRPSQKRHGVRSGRNHISPRTSLWAFSVIHCSKVSSLHAMNLLLGLSRSPGRFD